jgi:RNA polymerase sigma factor (sigma-70 family)
MARRPGPYAHRTESATTARPDPRSSVARAYAADRDQVLGVLARRCGWLGHAEREDVLHDAYVVLLEKQHRGEIDLASMSAGQRCAYLIRTAINKGLDAGKRVERKRTALFGDGDALRALADHSPGPDDVALARNRGGGVHDLVAELPDRQKQIIGLRYLLDCSPAEIQEQLGITARTYRRQLERAIAALASRGGSEPAPIGSP